MVYKKFTSKVFRWFQINIDLKKLFMIDNLTIIKTDLKGKKILIADRGRIDSLVRNYCALKILSEKYSIDPIILIQNSPKSFVNFTYRKLGIKKFIKTFDLRKNSIETVISLIKSIITFLKIGKFIYTKNFYEFIYKFKVLGVNIGDIVYDRYIRDNHNYLNPSFLNVNFLKYFFVTIYKVFYLSNYLDQNKIDLLVVNTHSYTNNYSIIFKLAKIKRINLLYLKDFQISYFKKGQYSIENDPRLLSKKKLNSIKFTREKKKILLKYMKKRILGNEDHFDVKCI